MSIAKSISTNPYDEADLRHIALHFDEARALSEASLEVWLNLFEKYVGANPGIRVIDLGCGTGRFSIPIARRFGFSLVGADRAEEMLAVAREKDPTCSVDWARLSGECLCFADTSFDVVFISQLLHQVTSPGNVLRECWRVLKPGGIILVRYCSFDKVKDDVEHRFFPDAVRIDEPKYPTTRVMENWLIDAGFKRISSETILQSSYKTGRERLMAVKSRVIAAHTIIPNDAFAAGVKALEEYVSNHPDEPWLLNKVLSLTVGSKSVA